MSNDKKKQVIGLYGEMRLSMELHELGWQVHRAYIDEGIDFIATKYYCPKCKQYSNQWIRTSTYKDKNGKTKNAKCVTNLCEKCQETELTVISRYLQVKTSEGVPTTKGSADAEIRDFSFHPKIRYCLGEEVFYIWIAVFDTPDNKKTHFYIFKTSDVSKFDDLSIASYQITDDQETHLYIRNDGVVTNGNSGRAKYDYSCFNNRFYNDWNALELEIN